MGQEPKQLQEEDILKYVTVALNYSKDANKVRECLS